MKRVNFYDQLDVSEKDEKQSVDLEKQYSNHFGSRQKMEAEASKLDPEILAARDELDDAIFTTTRPKMEAASERLNKAVRGKSAIRDSYFRRGEELRAKLEALTNPHKIEAMALLDREIERAKSRYTFQLPLDRVNTQGKVIDSPWRTVETERGAIRVTDVMTNADSVLAFQNLCVSAKSKVRDALSLKALKDALDGVQAELEKIGLEPKKKEIREDDLDRVNPSRITEVAYLTSDKVITLKATPASRVIGPNDFLRP